MLIAAPVVLMAAVRSMNQIRSTPCKEEERRNTEEVEGSSLGNSRAKY
jgi:hypothetical protein